MKTAVQYLSPRFPPTQTSFCFPESKKLYALLVKELLDDRAFEFTSISEEDVRGVCQKVSSFVQGKLFSTNDWQFVQELWTKEFIREATPLEQNMSTALVKIRQGIIEALPLPQKGVVVADPSKTSNGPCCTCTIL